METNQGLPLKKYLVSQKGNLTSKVNVFRSKNTCFVLLK